MTTETLYRELHAGIEGYVRKRINDPNLVADLVQDIFLKAHVKLRDLKDDRKMAPWLFSIARNTLTDHYRQKNELVSLANEEQVMPEEDNDELLACVRTLVASLPDSYKEPLVLSDLKGVKQDEIARQLGLSPSGARSRVQRARKMVRERFDACCVHFICGEEHKVRTGSLVMPCPACDN